MFWDCKANFAYFITLRMYAAQSDEYIYFDDYGEIAETGYSAD